MSQNICQVSDASFDDEVLKSPLPVLLDFWAPWCNPCRILGPRVDELSRDSRYTDRLKVAKINIDENPETPSRYGVRGIPTLMLFKGGNVEATHVGLLSKQELSAFIDSHL
ncbi:MAG: thioredoxin [Candidatus Accumulibacter sp.]|jgi:thioredoxin 1|nr:thioredoxin [Accumulibacter sp.]